MQLGEVAKDNPAVAIGSSPFFNPQQQECGARARDAGKLAQAKRAIEDMLERRQAQSNS
jgi:hypothetical protein